MAGALGRPIDDLAFVEASPDIANPATALTHKNLVVGSTEPVPRRTEEGDTMADSFRPCGFRRETVPFWTMDTSWTAVGVTRNPSTTLQEVVRIVRPETNPFSYGSFGQYVVRGSEKRLFFDTYKLLKRAFDLGVAIEGSVLDMVADEPAFLPVANEMMEAFVADLRDWDGSAGFLLRAFTDPDAGGRGAMQFVVRYSPGIPRDEMNRMWDEAADRLDEIVPEAELRLRVGITFQSFE